MRYRKPFTPDQRRDALREYDSFHRHVRMLRERFPARTKSERRSFDEYRRHVRKIGEQLLKMDRQVDVSELNAQVSLAKLAMYRCFRVRFDAGEV